MDLEGSQGPVLKELLVQRSAQTLSVILSRTFLCFIYYYSFCRNTMTFQKF